MKIAVACDHGGYPYKAEISACLREMGHTVRDFGCFSMESVDYPDFAFAACQAVREGECDKAVLLCGTGIGMSIAANKIPGIRCALCSETVSAKLTREHNDSNVLAMGARMIGIEMAKDILRVWMETPFSGEMRHIRRIEKIMQYEQR